MELVLILNGLNKYADKLALIGFKITFSIWTHNSFFEILIHDLVHGKWFEAFKTSKYGLVCVYVGVWMNEAMGQDNVFF